MVVPSPAPERGVWADACKSGWEWDKTKKAIHQDCFFRLERKTRLELALRASDLSRTIFTPPTPERGDLGSLRASHSLREYKMKKDSLKLSFSF